MTPAAQWITLGVWLLIISTLPALVVFAWFVPARQWVRWYGRPAIATVLKADRVATLPQIVTQVALELVPAGEPAYVRIRRSVRWSEHTMPPDQLTPGEQLHVRYRLARDTTAMPDARSR